MKKGYLTTSDKARIYYEDRGQGTPILFVPGHMCTTKFFTKNAEVLAKTHRVICMDPRGFGNSSKVLHGNTIERHSEDIGELIAHLGLENVMLFAWSLSGSAAVTYASRDQGRTLKGLGLIDCALYPFSDADWNSYNLKGFDMDGWNEKYQLWITDFDQYAANFLGRMDELLTSEETAMIKAEIRKTPPWIGFALHTDWCHTDGESLLKTLNVPVLICCGNSPGHHAYMSEHYCEEIVTYHELHFFEKGGHVLFMTEMEKFHQVVLDFIAKI